MNLKFKDFFTVAAVVAGFAGVALAMEGELAWASVAIVLGGFLDLGDGYVARLTKTQNKFGAEFDCIADLVIYSFAPAVLVFCCFLEINVWVAFVLGVLPLLFGCLRLARFNVKRIEYPGFWVGLPRPAVAAVIVSYLNSTLFLKFGFAWLGAAIVVVASFMSVSLLPFPGHHNRKGTSRLKVIVLVVVLSVVTAAVFGAIWDVLFFYSFLYLLSPLFSLGSVERGRFRQFVTAWKAEESSEY